MQRGVSAFRQWFVLCRRLVTQGLQGLPLYLGRIIFAVLISLVYGGSYWKLNQSFLGAKERTTILFIVSALLPALAVGTLPFYSNGSRVGSDARLLLNSSCSSPHQAWSVLLEWSFQVGAMLIGKRHL